MNTGDSHTKLPPVFLCYSISVPLIASDLITANFGLLSIMHKSARENLLARLVQSDDVRKNFLMYNIVVKWDNSFYFHLGGDVMKKILSLLLAAVLLISALPLTVSAAEVDDAAEVGASYGLWVGSTQVTDANKSDILGDGGKAKFDSTSKTLTLNNPTISGAHNDSTIYCNGFDLTVKGSYTMTAAQSDNALTVFDYALTLDGNFTFLAWCYAVEVSNDINVNGGRVIAKLTGDGDQSCAFSSDAGSLTFGDNVTYFEAEATDTTFSSGAVNYSPEGGTVTLSSKLKISTPEGGSFKNGSCFYYSGTKQKRAYKVVIEPANPSDIKYDVWVGSTQVTAVNKNDILGDGGKAKYDPSTATLTLNNPNITGSYNSSGYTDKIYAGSDITVKGSYTMTSYDADYGIDCYTNLTLDGDFTFLGKMYGVYARLSVTVNGSLVGRASSTTFTDSSGIKSDEIKFGELTRVEAEGKKVYAIYAARGLTITPEYEVTVPTASYIQNGTVVDNSTSTVAKRVVITPVVGGLGVFLGEKQVTESNASDIFGDGKASYDIDTKTLTLNYPTIRGCYTDERLLTFVIYAPDDITIEGSYNSINFSYDYGIFCGGNLTINAGIIRIGGKTGAILAYGDLTINGTGSGEVTARSDDNNNATVIGSNITLGSGLNRLEAEGPYAAMWGLLSITVSDELVLTAPANGVIKRPWIYESDGTTKAKKVVFTLAYKLWLGDTQVTEGNKDDILGDGGKAKYNSVTHTLTLNDPIFTGVYDGKSKIYSDGIDLTVRGSYHMTEAEADYGIYVPHGDLTLNGDFTFMVDRNSIRTDSNNINITGGSVSATSANGGGINAGNGSVTVGASVKSVTVTCGLCGIWGETGITIKGGTVTIASEENISIYSRKGDINITGGSVSATSAVRDSICTAVGDINITGGSLSVTAADGGGIDAVYGSVTVGSKVDNINIDSSFTGIYAKNDISLSAAKTDIKITGSSCGIRSDSGRVDIKRGSLKITALSQNGKGISAAMGISIDSAVNRVDINAYSLGMISAGTIAINGGSVSVTAADGIGINAENGSVTVGSKVDNINIDSALTGINAKNDISLSASNTVIKITGSSCGICSASGRVDIKRGILKISAVEENGEGINAIAGISIDSAVERVDIKADFRGIFSAGTLSINGGIVNIETTNNDPSSHSGCAICAAEKEGVISDVIIGKDLISLTAKGKFCGIWARNSVKISGGDVTARSYGSGYGILSYDSFRIDGGRLYAEGANNYDLMYSYLGIVVLEGDVVFSGDIFVDAQGPDGPHHALEWVRDAELIVEEVSAQRTKIYKEFDLWLGSTRVTTENMVDILGDGGKAKFKPETNTLTLYNATIKGTHSFTDKEGNNATCLIYESSYYSLTVKGSYDMSGGNIADYGIVVEKGSLLLNGNLTLWGHTVAAYAHDAFVVQGGDVKVGIDDLNNGYSVIAKYFRFLSDMGHFSSTGSISSELAIFIEEPLTVTIPSGAIVGYTTIKQSDGTAARTIEIKNPDPPYILGDVDGNGRVTIKDVLWIQRKLADMELPFEFDNKRADVDGDGKITINDATAIQYYLAEMKTSYPIGESRS